MYSSANANYTCIYVQVYLIYMYMMYKPRRLEELRGAFFSTFPHPPLTTPLSSHVVVVHVVTPPGETVIVDTIGP